MPTDITRDSFDPAQRFTRVVKQQGRLDLDADFNEQADILVYLQRSTVVDLLGRWCVVGDAFRVAAVTATPDDLSISPGTCYVDGIRLEIPAGPSPLLYSTQPVPDAGFDRNWVDGDYLVFLDVWEQDVTAQVDPSIADVALGGADTAARSKVMWQVKVRRVLSDAASLTAVTYDKTGLGADAYRKVIDSELSPGLADAKLAPAQLAAATPDGYRRPENHLYRVQVHDGGDATRATFKWSRDNASVQFVGRRAATNDQVELGANDSRRTGGLDVGDVVEVFDGRTVQGPAQGQLAQVVSVGGHGTRVGLTPGSLSGLAEPTLYLRKWDHTAADVAANGPLTVPVRAGDLVDVEGGLQVRFAAGTQFRAGEYWLVPARAGVGDVVWPQEGDAPADRPAHGGRHHYAPLAIVIRRTGTMQSVRPTRTLLARDRFVKADA